MLALADFAEMAPEERRAALVELTTGRPNGVRVAAEIRQLEQRYEMTSEQMRAKVRTGKLDTADTARWLVLLDALGR